MEGEGPVPSGVTRPRLPRPCPRPWMFLVTVGPRTSRGASWDVTRRLRVWTPGGGRSVLGCDKAAALVDPGRGTSLLTHEPSCWPFCTLHFPRPSRTVPSPRGPRPPVESSGPSQAGPILGSELGPRGRPGPARASDSAQTGCRGSARQCLCRALGASAVGPLSIWGVLAPRVPRGRWGLGQGPPLRPHLPAPRTASPGDSRAPRPARAGRAGQGWASARPPRPPTRVSVGL